MNDAATTPNAKANRGRKTIFVLLAVAFNLFAIFILGEILLRLVPIAGVNFNVYTYDHDLGVGLYPHTTVIYRNDKGVYVKRKVNRWGYLDKNHNQHKPEGVFRVGFFGDSYTEAEHVALEDTFFRRIESSLKQKQVETLAFGVSGNSMLQAYMLYQRWVDFFDIDLVVYVFVENDLGDQVKEIDRTGDRPYLFLTDTGTSIDYGFRAKNKHKASKLFKIGDWLTAKSLLIAVVSERIKLLKKYGIKMRADKEQRTMATRAADELNVNAIDLPSSWPAQLRLRAQKLGAVQLLKWRAEAIKQRKTFAVLYVPRQSEFKKPIVQQDSWKLWLQTLCRDSRISFIDPTNAFMRNEAAGAPVYYDHFTPAGHKVFAAAFVQWFEQNYSRDPKKD